MSDKSNYRPCAGAVLTLIAAIINFLRPLVNQIITIRTYSENYGMDQALQLLLPNLLMILISGLFAALPIVFFSVVLIRKNRSTITVVSAAIMAGTALLSTGALLILQTIMNAYSTLPTSIFNVSAIPLLVCYVLLMILCVSVNRPQPGSFAKLWFLPGAAYIVYVPVYLGQIISNQFSLYPDSFQPDSTFIVSILVTTLLSNLPILALYCVGYFLIGKWLANPFRRDTPAEPVYPAGDAPQNPADTFQSADTVRYTQDEDSYLKHKEL